MNYTKPRSSLCLPLALLTGMLLFAQQALLLAGLSSQDVARIVVGKQIFYFQDGASPTLETHDPYGALALIQLTETGSLTGTPTFTFDPGGTGTPSFNFMNEGDNEWFVEGEFADIATLNSTVPSGAYEISFTGTTDGNLSDTVTMPSATQDSDFPGAPDFANFESELSGMTNFSVAFDIVVTIPTTADPNDVLVIFIEDEQNDEDIDLEAVVPERQASSSTTHPFSIPAGLLADGGGYEVCVTLVDATSVSPTFGGFDLPVIVGLLSETCIELGDTTQRNLQLDFGIDEQFNFGDPVENTVTTGISGETVTPNYGLFYGLEGNPEDFPPKENVTFDADDNNLDGPAENAFIPDSFGFGNYNSVRAAVPAISTLNASVSFSGVEQASEIFDLLTAASNHLVFVPTVTLDELENIVSIDWTYQDINGFSFEASEVINRIFITISGRGEEFTVLDENFDISGLSTSYLPSSITINWGDVGGISLGYNDVNNNSYNQFFGTGSGSGGDTFTLRLLFAYNSQMGDPANDMVTPVPDGFPVDNLGYTLLYSREVIPPPASIDPSEVTFSDPDGSVFNGSPAVEAGVDEGGIFASSDTAPVTAGNADMSYPDSGNYSANYDTHFDTVSIDTSMAEPRHFIVSPTVSLSGGIIQTIIWEYVDPATGSTQGTLGFTLNDVQVGISRFTAPEFKQGFAFEESIDVSAEGIPWADVSSIGIQYQDDKDIVYSSQYATNNVPPEPSASIGMLFLTEGALEDSQGPAIEIEPFATETNNSFSAGILSYFLAFDLEVFPPPNTVDTSEVTFTSPVNNNFNGEISELAIVTDTGIFAQSLSVPLLGDDSDNMYPDFSTEPEPGANAGNYTARYMDMDYTTSIDPTDAFFNHYTVKPTVNVSAGNIATITWNYLSPFDSSVLETRDLLDVTITDVVISIFRFDGNDFVQRNLTDDMIDLTAENIPWNQVESIDIAYVDDQGIVYESRYATRNTGGPTEWDIRVHMLSGAGTFNEPDGGTVTVGMFPDDPGYLMVFNVTDTFFPPPGEVLFTDAAGSGLNLMPAASSNFGGLSTTYFTEVVNVPTDPPTGAINDNYTVNYKGQDFIKPFDTSNAVNDHRVLLPTVTLDGVDEIATVSWTYNNRDTGLEASTPAGISRILMIINANGVPAYVNGAIDTGAVSVDVSASNIFWPNVDSIFFLYTDAADIDHRSFFLTSMSQEGEPDPTAPESEPVFSMFQANAPVGGGFFGFPLARLDDNNFIVGEGETDLHIYNRDTGFARSLDTSVLGGGEIGAVAALGTGQILAGSEDITVDSEPGAGAVFIFNASDGSFDNKTIENPEPAFDDAFGFSIAVLGTSFIAIGADLDDPGGINDAGSVYLFDANTLALNTTIRKTTPVANDGFGLQLAAVGTDRLLIGAPQGETDDHLNTAGPGEAYLYDTGNTTLNPLSRPDTPATGDLFGTALAAVGTNTLAVGAPGVNNTEGAVYLYDATTRNHLRTLVSPNPVADEFFGTALAAVGDDRLLVGATEIPGDEGGNPTLAGRAYLFDLNGNHLKTFTASSPTIGDVFGGAMAALDENTVVISAPLDDSLGTNAGKAYLFDVTPPAADVSLYGVIKFKGFVQIDNSFVTTAFFSGFEFNAFVFPSEPGRVFSADVTPAGGNLIMLEEGGDDFDFEAEFDSQNELDTAFPNTDYTFDIFTLNDGERMPVLTLGNGTFETAPQLTATSFDALQDADADAPISMEWIAHTGATANDFIIIEIFRPENGDTVFETPIPFIEEGVIGGDETGPVVLPAGTLERGRQYSGLITFFKGDSLDETSYPGAIGITAFASETFFSFNTIIAFDDWATDNIPDPGARGTADDPDGDGIPNALEYYFGLDPLAADNFGLPVLTRIEGGDPGPLTVDNVDELVVTYTRRIGAASFPVEWQISQDLASWIRANVLNEFVVDSTGETVTVEAHIEIPVGSDKVFVRLQLNANPF